MNEATERRYSIDELAALVELPRRTVRYYIQQGLVDRPHGSRRAAYYTNRHLEQLLEIRKWQRAGLSLERIRELLRAPEQGELPPPRPRGRGSVEVWSHVVIDPGIELHLAPDQANLSPEQVRTLARELVALVDRIRKGGRT
ncbi:MAG: MerR family transcriptional regulator [Gammaproteobacteria bacterium]|nr:MAG: MerR family transcriptional regulator [Gammaproteobacteria bacterium]